MSNREKSCTKLIYQALETLDNFLIFVKIEDFSCRVWYNKWRVHKSTIVFGHDTMPQTLKLRGALGAAERSEGGDLFDSSKTTWTCQTLFLSAFAIMVFIGIITGSIVVSVMALYVFNALEDAPIVDLSNVEVNLNNTSYIYVTDPDTQEQTVVKELYSGQNREWVSYSEIPQTLIDVTVAAEDKRFREHHGVDWLRTIRSTLGYFGGSSRIQGGSTITQQVIKNLTGNDEVTPERKVQEIFTALKLEKNYSKEQILETYLNVAFFSNQCYGIQSASKLYFNKDISELNVAEAATLIAITNAPTRYNPLRENPNEDYGWGTGMEENKERRDYILGEMLDAGMLTQSEYEEWINYEVQLAPREEVQSTSDGLTALTDWHTDQVIEDVITDLQEEYNYTRAYATNMVYSGGYRIYSTMDPDIQQSLEDSYANPDTFPALNNSEYPETAAIVIAPDGSVKGMIGGNEKTSNRLFNRATQSQRHPGSTMKPISAYLNAFERDLITWSTTFVDEPLTLTENGETFEWPVNYTNNYTHEPMTVQYAVQQSINTVPAQIVNILTPQVCYDTLKNKFQISTLQEADATSLSAMALGGMTTGMTLEELVGCYQIFVTGGMYVKPYTYTHVTDMEGNVILEKDTTQVRVISEETATVLNRLLQTVVSRGTGAQANIQNQTGIVTAGKTGSSTGVKYVNGVQVDIDNPDLWFIGFTPYYIGGVWMGYDIQEEIYYSTYPTPILWKNLMLPIHEGLEAADFTYSENVQALQYCTESGDLATENCPSTATGWYKETYIPSSCILHRSSSTTTAEPESENEDNSSSTSDGESGGRRVITREEQEQNQSSGSNSSSSSSDSSGESEGGSFWDSVSSLFGRTR